MRKDDFFEVLGEIDDDILKGAKTNMEMKKKMNWKVWGGAAAACLCLAAGAAVILHQSSSGKVDVGGVPVAGVGGAVIGDEGGNESVMYSVAVYPAFESEKNVASAEVVSLTESEALNNPLAKHLPKELPEGFHYGRGSVYNTVMKDGARYNMLRVEYISGTIPEQQFTEDGGVSVPNPEVIGDLFTVCVMNHEPEIDTSIYSSNEEVTLSLLEENGSAYIRLGDCCVGIFTGTAEPATVLDAIKNIG